MPTTYAGINLITMVEGELIERLIFGDSLTEDKELFPPLLQLALKHVEAFLDNPGLDVGLCIVMPVKKQASQWLSIPLTLDRLRKNYHTYKGEIYRSHEHYQIGDRLMLNDSAVVAWAGSNENSIRFWTKSEKNSSSPEISVKFRNIAKLKPAPLGRKELSTFKKVKEAFSTIENLPAQRLLGINLQGNDMFNKKSICLVGTFKNFQVATERLNINDAVISDYFTTGRISDSGSKTSSQPLLLSNDLTEMATFDGLADRICLLMIDGAGIVKSNLTNLHDIKNYGIPVVVITELSEIEHFPLIADLGLKILDLTGEDQTLISDQVCSGPFLSFKKQLEVYNRFTVDIERCENTALENLVSKVSSISNDESNIDLINLRSMLVRFFNYAASLVHNPSDIEIQQLQVKENQISELYQKSQNWLGESAEEVSDAISTLSAVTTSLSIQPPSKYLRLQELLSSQCIDYIICSRASETAAVESMLNETKCLSRPHVITAADIPRLGPLEESASALVISWLRIKYMTDLINCYRFTRLTLLFYEFEVGFFRSLERQIAQQANSLGVKTRTWYNNGGISQTAFISTDKAVEERLFRLADTSIIGNTVTSQSTEILYTKAIIFDNDQCFYATESHKFYVISDVKEVRNTNIQLNSSRTDSLSPKDIIALISTQRDIVVELIERSADPEKLKTVKYWTGLWKKLIQEHYRKSNRNFAELVSSLRENGCKRHEATIRNWLQDNNQIGPDDDSDLISISLVTGSELLYENIDQVRHCINIMTGWRMRAAEQVMLLIRRQLQRGDIDDLLYNFGGTIVVPGLGTVNLLRINFIDDLYRRQDARYVNRLLNQGGV